MMICPETFYEMNLKGKTAEQIMTVIRSLKQEIGRLKNIVEHPNYVCTMLPSECARISCSRDYLGRAKQALEEVGGAYTPSATEHKVMEFDVNIPYINKVVFCIGGYLDGCETRIYTVHGDKIHTDVEHPLILKPSNIGEIEEMDKDYFLEAIEDLHIGGWHKPVKIYGDNAYPYNFDRVLELF